MEGGEQGRNVLIGRMNFACGELRDFFCRLVFNVLGVRKIFLPRGESGEVLFGLEFLTILTPALCASQTSEPCLSKRYALLIQTCCTSYAPDPCTHCFISF